MGKYRALTIAKWFILRNRAQEEYGDIEPLTLLKLLKLLYYAEGCSLALNNGSLFSEHIVAWEHGPVVKEVYNNFPNAYKLDIAEGDISELEVAPEDTSILEQVFDVFGEYSAWGLRNKTHQEDPWKLATNDGKILNGTISRKVMQEYFAENYVSE